MKRVGIYCRVSTDKQDTDNQLRELQAFAAQQGWEITGEFIDTVSGSGKKARPQFEACMLAASQRKFDVLLFWKLDRLTREGARRALQYLTQLDGWQVAWRSYTEPFFDSCGPFKDVVVSIMSTLDNLERVKISERTKAGLAGAIRKGKSLGRPHSTNPSRTTLWRRAKAKQDCLGQL